MTLVSQQRINKLDEHMEYLKGKLKIHSYQKSSVWKTWQIFMNLLKFHIKINKFNFSSFIQFQWELKI